MHALDKWNSMWAFKLYTASRSFCGRKCSYEVTCSEECRKERPRNDSFYFLLNFDPAAAATLAFFFSGPALLPVSPLCMHGGHLSHVDTAWSNHYVMDHWSHFPHNFNFNEDMPSYRTQCILTVLWQFHNINYPPHYILLIVFSV